MLMKRKLENGPINKPINNMGTQYLIELIIFKFKLSRSKI